MAELETSVVTKVYPGEYRDSLFLMKLSNDISSWPDVEQAVIFVGTEGNKRILDQLGLLSEGAKQATAHDLIVAARTSRPEEMFLAALNNRIRETDQHRDITDGYRSLGGALATRDDTDLVFLSIPGEYVTPLAQEALENGKHVFCFSHHISIEDEIALKLMAIERQLLMMGPDCGTAVLDGIGLGFANQVRPGQIGIVSASGSGLQEVMSLIDRYGGGVSQAIGVGGRDLSEEVGGLMCEQAIRKLAGRDDTKVIVILAKKASPDAIRRVLAAANEADIPVVADFARAAADNLLSNSNAILVDTFEDCARQALHLCGIDWAGSTDTREVQVSLNQMLGKLETSRRRVYGLFGGGSLCAESRNIMLKHDLTVSTNLDGPLPNDASGHILLDLGAEEFTQGLPHPFIDQRVRSMKLAQACAHPEVAILLLDVVLGWGCHPDPAGEVVNVLNQSNIGSSNGPIIIASVCGTESDPQRYSWQRNKLIEAGVLVTGSNAQGAFLAAEAVRALETSRT